MNLNLYIILALSIMLNACGSSSSGTPVNPVTPPVDLGLLSRIELTPNTSASELFVTDVVTYSATGIHELGIMNYTADTVFTLDPTMAAILNGSTVTLNAPSTLVTVNADYNGYTAVSNFAVWHITGITLLTNNVQISLSSGFALSSAISFDITDGSNTNVRAYKRGFNDQPLVTFISNDTAVVTVLDPQTGNLQPQGVGSTTVDICTVVDPAVCAVLTVNVTAP
ncbi:MAG: hypothetical protein OEY61_09530 [Gammaproteobacteria bacterium]|nr:hypothetical protein [Gammaproteobacteria bacterium]